MRYDSWFNVRLMNCEIFIFTSSLSSWDPFSFIKGQLFKRSLTRTYVSYSKLQRRVICEPYFVSCVTIFIFLHRNNRYLYLKLEYFNIPILIFFDLSAKVNEWILVRCFQLLILWTKS